MASTTVTSFSDLKTAIADPLITEIFLGADIVFNVTGGVEIPRIKTGLIIDGMSLYKITDYRSVAITDTVRVQNAAGAPMQLTLRNLTWSGRNYYGMLYVPESANHSNVTLNIENITYTGPQAIFNRRGITRVQNSDFTLRANDGSVAPQEFAEINRLYISGTVTINSEASVSNSDIWFTYDNTYLTVETGATFNVNCPNSYMFYADASTPVMRFEDNSDTNITTNRGLWISASAVLHCASTFYLGANASFTSVQDIVSAGVPAFKCGTQLTAEENSMLYLAVKGGSNSAPLIRFSSVAAMNFNNPRSVVLYNAAGNVLSFYTAGTTANRNSLNISAELVNIWQTAGAYPVAGTFADPPTRMYEKKDGSNVTVTVKTTTDSVTDFSSNIADGDTGMPMDPATFNILTARVLSFGRLPLETGELSYLSTEINGSTEPDASVKAEYLTQSLLGAADADGKFSLGLPSSITSGTTVKTGANWRFLTKYIEQSVTAGSILITHLEPLDFGAFILPCTRGKVKRLKTDWYVEVTDMRETGGDWQLYASLPRPLHKDADNITGELVFIEGGVSQIMTPAPISVYRGEWAPPPAVTSVSWNADEGFLLRIFPEYFCPAGRYVSELSWEVKPVD